MGQNVSPERKKLVVFLGPAGSGKTTLVGSYGKWLEKEMNVKVSYVNLDPGAEVLFYSPDFDIRELFTIRDIMVKEKLGPNGAFIRGMDLMLQMKKEILDSIKKIEGDYILVDTPGQMELFVFRETGPELLSALRYVGYVVGVLLFDPVMASSPPSLVAMKLLSLVVQLRLGIDNVLILNKIDAVKNSDVLRLVEDYESLKEALAFDSKGLVSDMASSLIDVVEEYTPASRLVKISALKKAGFEELYDILHEVFCTCGDLT